MRKRWRLGALGVLLAAVGCGDLFPGCENMPYEGIYSAEYAQPASGTLTIAVPPHGAVEVVIVDSQAGTFVGKGTLKGGALTATANRRGGSGSVGVTGQFVNEMGDVTASGLLAGAIGINWSAQQIADWGTHAFAGSYAGSYTGSEQGTWRASVSDQGRADATLQSPSLGNLTLQGQVSEAGWALLQGSAYVGTVNVSVIWEGAFFMSGQQARGSGVWRSSSGLQGDWTGQRQASGAQE